MSLLNMLRSSGTALDAFAQALQVTQNNVANASTPGYVRQRQPLCALQFDPANGAIGGVRAGAIESARDLFAERSVRRETSSLGMAEQSAATFSELNSLFDISDGSGLPYALNNLYRSFSGWAQSPADSVARQAVIDRASEVADQFRGIAAKITQTNSDVYRQIGQTVDTVNALTAKIAGYNRRAIEGGQNDAGLDAARSAALEELSQYVDFTTVMQDSGAVAVLLDGQIPLVMDSRQYALAGALKVPADDQAYAGAPRQAQIISGDADVTGYVTSGKLAGLLEIRNQVIPSYIGGASQPGDLNILAKSFATRVNDLLTGGYIANADPPENGSPLFGFNTDDDTCVAATLRVSPTIKPDQLAAIEPGEPPVANGIALRLSALANPQSANDEVNGASFMGFYGQLAARAGSKLTAAQDKQAVQQSAVAQAKNLRQQSSGVSLDEEAMILVEFQRAYQANSKIISVLDELTQSAINMLNG